MKKIITLSTLAMLVTVVPANAQSSPTSFDVISWNLEFFGAPFASGPADKDLQEANAKKLMRHFDADIYGLVEIVDTTHLRKLRDSLGTNYEYIMAPYGVNNAVIGSNAWRQDQKLCFLYKKDVFTNISTRGLMLTSPTAVSNWATGRVPFLFKADATINGITKTVHIILVHGKSGSTANDYTRRLAGAQELKDTLDAQFSNANVFIIGDYNDALNQTISIGSGPQSSYHPIIVDSVDTDHYKSVTLPLANAGQTTMINFPNVIDNHVISNELTPFYVLSSAQVRTDVTTIVPDYVTAHTTSDHYPVFSKYSFAGIVTGVPTVNPNEFGIKAFPNPWVDELNLKATKTLTNVRVRMIDMQGKTIATYSYGIIPAGTGIQPHLPTVQKGIYFLQVETKQFKTTLKLTKF